MREPSKRAPSFTIKELTICALFTALVLVFTMFINLRLPLPGSGGLIHLGNIPLMVCALVFGKRAGAIAGALGMAAFDLISGWLPWAPFTLVIVGIMGYAMGALSADGKNGMFWSLLAVLIAMIIKIVGYYCAEVLLYGNWVTPLGSIPGNVLQIAIAAVVALPVATVLRRQIHTGRADRPAGQ